MKIADYANFSSLLLPLGTKKRKNNYHWEQKYKNKIRIKMNNEIIFK